MKNESQGISQCPDGRSLEEQPRWRRDFPIDVAEDGYVARRDFARFMILISGAFAVGQLWIGLQNRVRRYRSGLPLLPIVEVSAVPVGGVVEFSYPGESDRCLLIRPDADALVAFRQECTHLSCGVQPRPERDRFECPCHAGVFDLRTGRPTAGPPRRPLVRVLLEIRAGTVYAAGEELRT